MKNNKHIFLILLLIIPALACSSTLTRPAPTQSVTTVTVPPSPTIGPTFTATASAESCEVTAESLHLRDAPNVSGQVIAWLEQGDQLTILPTKPSGDWIQIQFASVTGWINSIYCERK